MLSVRPEDIAADDEYAAMLRCAGLDEQHLRRVRLDRDRLDAFAVDDWSGVVLGGGPFQVSDPHDAKPAVQRHVESDIARVLDQVVARDSPFLGACYGIGVLGQHQGAVIDRAFGEPVGAIRIKVTDEGARDPLFRIAGASFGAFGGHKEAASRLPGHAVTLATSPACPVQAFRIGTRAYATQFHPELDLAGLATRVETYKHAGYFPPDRAAQIIDEARSSGVTRPPNFLRRFVELFAAD